MIFHTVQQQDIYFSVHLQLSRARTASFRRVPPCPYPSSLPDFVTFTWAGAAPSWARPLENNISRKKLTHSEKALCI